MAKKKKKKPVKEIHPQAITARDVGIMQALYRYRFLTTPLIRRLLFGSSHLRAAQYRAKQLRDFGLLGRRQTVELADPNSPLSSRFVYFLTTEGGEYLGLDEPERLLDHNQVSVGAVNHYMMTNRFMIELELACKQVGFTFAEHLDELVLRGDYDRVPISEGQRTVKVAVIPDTYVAIQTPRYDDPSHLLIEMDMGTEKSSIIKRKVKAYIKYLKTEAIFERFGSENMRILFVAKTKRRAENLKKYAEAAKAKKRFWFSSLDVLQAETLFREPHWHIASQEKKAVLLRAP